MADHIKKNKVKAELDRMTSLLNPTYCFTKRIRCGICGDVHPQERKSQRQDLLHWICRSKKEVGMTYSSVNFSEEELKNICADVLETDSLDEEIFEIRVKDIIVFKNGDL